MSIHAIDLEGALKKASGQPVPPELFSRSIQHIGLFIGYLLYGIGWGALFGVVASLLPLLTRAPFSVKQALGLLLASCWTVGIFPQLKYPANPPGVGEPATISFRQEVYLAMLLLSILGTFLAAIAYQALGRASKGWQQLMTSGSTNEELALSRSTNWQASSKEMAELFHNFNCQLTHWRNSGGQAVTVIVPVALLVMPSGWLPILWTRVLE